MKRKSLIFSIIKDDLVNYKLICGLNDIGLYADGYLLRASGTLMKLMKIKSDSPRWEEIHEYYLNNLERIRQVDIFRSDRQLDALTTDIYDFLKQMKREEKMIEKRAKELVTEQLATS